MKSLERRIKSIEEHCKNQPQEETRTMRFSPVLAEMFGGRKATEKERAEHYRKLEEKEERVRAYYEKHGKPMRESWAGRIIRYRLNSTLFKTLGAGEPGYEEALRFCK